MLHQSLSVTNAWRGDARQEVFVPTATSGSLARDESGSAMPTSIGIRVYKCSAHRRGELEALPLAADELSPTVETFLSEFPAAYQTSVHNEALERSWYFEQRTDDGAGTGTGYVHYGTFGFESNLVDSRTQRTNYRRQSSDVEEIPLFYEFWCPPDTDFALVAFQSFQARSCIGIVMSQMREDFERRNRRHVLSFRKVLPNDVRGSLYYSAPVKRLTLIRERAPSDVTDAYYRADTHTGIDFEVSLRARRNGALGKLADIAGMLGRDSAGLVLHDGIEFNKAVAEIRIGNRTRKVGVFGSDSEAGLIDLTDVVKRGPDGHPTFESMTEHSDDILQSFYKVLAG